MKMIYNIDDKPKFGDLLLFAIQQLLAIMAATIAVPVIIGHGMQPSAALFGAGAGTLVYVLFTRGRSPVFLGSSFAFIGSMTAAFAGGISMYLGYAGLIIGAIFAGLVYVIIAIIVKFAGVKWIAKLMPAVVIGPTVAIIGLSLAGSAVTNLTTGAFKGTSSHICVLVGLITLAVTMLCSTGKRRMPKLIPFIIGILAGYIVATIFTVIGMKTGNETLKVIDYTAFTALFADGAKLSSFLSVPTFSFINASKGLSNISGSYIATIAVAYIPVAFVVFAEHIADHKNLSSIIEKDLLEDPGLHRTLMGDGVGSMVGAFFGGCPNTTYGESIACVAITKNASVFSIVGAALLAIIISFLSPFVAFLNTIPSCVMGGVCIALYGFIAVSGLKMIQKVDLDKNSNLFVVSVILISGIGGLTISFGKITITEVACALILGILTNLVLSKRDKTNENPVEIIDEEKDR